MRSTRTDVYSDISSRETFPYYVTMPLKMHMRISDLMLLSVSRTHPDMIKHGGPRRVPKHVDGGIGTLQWHRKYPAAPLSPFKQNKAAQHNHRY